jgi:ribose/xylose/arabinose/galactoside ABC-type transport system permease subunit
MKMARRSSEVKQLQAAKKRNGQGQMARVRKGNPRVSPILFSVGLLLAMLIVFTIGNHNFISGYNIGTITNYAAILMVVALGQMATILIGGIDLSVGGTVSFISVVFVTAIKSNGYWAYPEVIAIGVFIGFINGSILTRIKIPSFIATLGTGGILASLALLVSPLPMDVPAGAYKLLDIVNASVLGISNVLIIGLLFFFAVYVLLRYIRIGRNIYYVGSNIKMSWMSGIDIIKTRNFAYIMSGVAASLTGIMLSCAQFGGDPTVGTVYNLNSIAAVVVGGTALTGGTGGAVNTLIGALIMSVLENGMNVIGVNVFFQQSILGIMVIASVILTFDRAKNPMIK